MESFGNNILNTTVTVDKIKNIDKVLAVKSYFHFSIGERIRAERFLRHAQKTIHNIEDFESLKTYMATLWGENYEEVVYFTHRVYDWSKRPEKSRISELENRLPELTSRNLTSLRVLKTLEPLEAYWKKHIFSLLESNNTFPKKYPLHSSSDLSILTQHPFIIGFAASLPICLAAIVVRYLSKDHDKLYGKRDMNV